MEIGGSPRNPAKYKRLSSFGHARPKRSMRAEMPHFLRNYKSSLGPVGDRFTQERQEGKVIRLIRPMRLGKPGRGTIQMAWCKH